MTGTIAVAQWTPERVTLVATRETWEELASQLRATGITHQAGTLILERLGQQQGVVSIDVTPKQAEVIRGAT